MKIVIGGCGRVGASLALRLGAEGHDVAVIDKSAEALRRLGRGFGGTTQRGMVFDRETLERAGIERADAFIAVTSGDNSNVVAATIARDEFRVPKVVARIFDPRRAEIYRRLGIQTVSSVSWATAEIASLVLYQHAVRDLSLGDGEVQVVRSSVPPRLVGRTVADLTVPGEVMVFAVVRAGSSHIPSSHETLRDGDVIEAAVLTTALNRYEQMTAP